MNTVHHLPRWGYIALTVVCVGMGVWAGYVTLEYFKHGARALESDAELQALALVAALMFVASEMGSFLIAAMMTERQLWARRWALTLFAFSVLGLEVCTIVAVQLALTTGADMGQATIAQREKDLRGRIADIESDAAITRDAGATQTMAAKGIKDAGARAWALQQASKTVGKASARSAELSRLHEQLEALTAQKRPTLVGILGKDNALYYAVARGILISMGGLVFFGAAGAFLRMARGGKPANEVPQPEVKPARSFIRESVKPEGASTHWDWEGLIKRAGLALGLASLAGAANAAPPITPKQVQTEGGEYTQTSVKAAPDTPKRVQSKKRAKRVHTDAEKRKYALLLKDVSEAVQARRIKPVQEAIKAYADCGQTVAERLQLDMQAAGLIKRLGRGWKLA